MHPLTWWAWALALAAAATRTTSVAMHTVLLVAAVTVVAARLGRPGLAAMRTFLLLGAVVVGVRVVFHVLVGLKVPGPALLDLPTVRLPEWAPGIQLLGPVTAQGLLGALAGGLQLAALIVLLGAAAVLADPRRVLRVVPASLHQLATAVVIAVSVTPRLASSAQEVRRAQRLRGADGPDRHLVRRLVVPVLSDALDRALDLAASMDSRGYARGTGEPDRRVLPLLGTSVVAIAVAVYAALDGTTHSALAPSALVLATAAGLAGSRLAGRRSVRTRYVAERWGLPESVVVTAAALAGLLVAAVGGAAVPTLVLALAVGGLACVPAGLGAKGPGLVHA